MALRSYWDQEKSKQKKDDMLRSFGIKSTPKLDEEIYNIEQAGYDGPHPMMEERFPAPEKQGLSERAIPLGANSDIEKRLTGAEGPRMTPEMLREMAIKRQQQKEVQGGGAQSEREERHGPAQRGRTGTPQSGPSYMGDMSNQGLDASVGMVGEQPSEEQLGMLGRNPALAGINQADEARTRDAIGQMDATEMQAAEAGSQKSAEVAAQQMDDAGLMNTKRQEPKQPDDPASAELAQLNTEAVSKNPAKKARALKEREKLFAGLSKEERAFAKEELGNYYIDPLSGHAVNLDAMAASDKRAAQVALLKYIPEHQRTTMMGKFGWIDAEDIKDLPESDTVKAEEIKAASALAVQDLINSGNKETLETSVGSKERMQKRQLQFEYKSLGDKTNIDQQKLDILKENGIKDRELKRYGIDNSTLPATTLMRCN